MTLTWFESLILKSLKINEIDSKISQKAIEGHSIRKRSIRASYPWISSRLQGTHSNVFGFWNWFSGQFAPTETDNAFKSKLISYHLLTRVMLKITDYKQDLSYLVCFPMNQIISVSWVLVRASVNLWLHCEAWDRKIIVRIHFYETSDSTGIIPDFISGRSNRWPHYDSYDSWSA